MYFSFYQSNEIIYRCLYAHFDHEFMCSQCEYSEQHVETSYYTLDNLH